MRKRQRVYTSTLLVYRIGHPMQLRTSTWARRSHKILTTSPSKKGFDPNRYAFQNTAGVYVYHHICMPVLSANTDINHFSIDACLHPMELVRRPNIFIEEGVWSNSVIHRDSVTTPEYCWYIASHCYACCLPIQTYTCATTFNGTKMAKYLHPGRGVVKPSDQQR